MESLQTSRKYSGIQVNLDGMFFDRLPRNTLKDMLSLAAFQSYPARRVLFSEQERSTGFHIVLDGAVKLSMNSSEGRRFVLGIAKESEFLALSSSLSGGPREVTAETFYPTTTAFIAQRDFLDFLARHPEVYEILTEELSRDYVLACGLLRMVGLASSVPERLARLLLDWSQNGQTTDSGTRVRFPLTHSEIGELIGASREAVTRNLSLMKSRNLVAIQGSMLTIPSRSALERYTGRW